jgi:hypothetical protein
VQLSSSASAALFIEHTISSPPPWTWRFLRACPDKPALDQFLSITNVILKQMFELMTWNATLRHPSRMQVAAAHSRRI